MSEIILALDPSTKMGVVVLEVTGKRVYVVLREEYSSTKKGMERLGDIARYMSEILTKYKPTAVIVEGYSFMSKHNLVTMAEVGTVVRFFLWQEDYDYIELPPTSLKKFVTGKGQAKKDLMLLNVYKLWGFDTDNDNIADAFALGMYALYDSRGLVSKTGTSLKSTAKEFDIKCK